MLMISSLELLFLASDYLTFLLEPIIKRILNALSYFGRVTYCVNCPWLVTGESVKISLEGLSREMERFEEMYFRTRNDTHEMRLSLLHSLQQTILDTWPWIKGFHLSQVSSIDCQLNWTNYDLCIVDDWDIPNLAPLLSVELSLESELIALTSSAVAKIPRSLNEKCYLPDMSESCSHRYPPGEGPFFLYVSRKKRDHAAPRCEAQSARKLTSGCPLICVKMMKTSDFQRHSLRSTLVFYYTQIHPDLNALYLVVGRSLELAGLLEPSASLAAASEVVASSADDRVRTSSKQGEGNVPDEGQHYYFLTRYALVLMLVAFFDSPSFRTIKEKFENTPAYLARLLLAFLESYSQHSALLESGKGRFCIRPSLGEAGKLELSLEGGEECKFLCREEVNEQRKREKLARKSQLLVLDPLPWTSAAAVAPQNEKSHEQVVEGAKGKDKTMTCNRRANKLIALNDINKRPSDLGRLTNLTKDFLSLGQVLCLFRRQSERLLEYISKADEFASEGSEECVGNNARSLLDSLFTLSSCKAASQTNEFGGAHFTSEKEEEEDEDEEASAVKAPLIINDSLRYSAFLEETRRAEEEAAKSEASGLRENRKVALPLLSLLSSKGVSSHQAARRRRNKLRRSDGPGAFRLSWRKILTNLLYLCLFLLVRRQLLSHLNGFMSSMNERAREDLIQLKYTFLRHDGGSFFAEAYQVHAKDVQQEEEPEEKASSSNGQPPEEMGSKVVEEKTVQAEGDLFPSEGRHKELDEEQPKATSETEPEGLSSPPDSEASEAPLISSEPKDEIWQENTKEADKNTKDENQAGAQVGTDGQELLGELMKSLMMEAIGGGDFNLASLFNDEDESGFNETSLDDDEDKDDDEDEDDAQLTTPSSVAQNSIDAKVHEEAGENEDESQLVRYENEDKLDLSEMRDLFKNLKIVVRGAASIAKFLKPGKQPDTENRHSIANEAKDTPNVETSTLDTEKVPEPHMVNIDNVNQTESPENPAESDHVKLAEPQEAKEKQQKAEATARDEL